MNLVSSTASPPFRAFIALVCSIVLVSRGRTRSARLLAVAVSGGAFLNTVIKAIVERRRPPPLLGVKQATGSSFPSGHSNGAFVLSGTLTFILWHVTRRRSVLAVAGVLGSVMTVIIGYTRVALRHHHLGDVIGGYAVGATWLAVSLRLFRHSIEYEHRRSVERSQSQV